MNTCQDCSMPTNGNGWHVGDTFGTTYGTMKQAQREATISGIRSAMDYLEEINDHTGANAVAEFLEFLQGEQVNRSEWLQPFLDLNVLPSRKCEITETTAPGNVENFSNSVSAAQNCEEKKLEFLECIVCAVEIDNDNPFARFCANCEKAHEFGITGGIFSAIQTLEAEDFTEHANILRNAYNMKEAN